MTIGDDLQKEVETTKEKVSSLIAELETFAEIKSNLSSADNNLNKSIKSFDELIRSMTTISSSLDEVASTFEELIKKLDQIDTLTEKVETIEDLITELSTQVSNSHHELEEKIKKSTILGRLTIK